MFPESRPHQLAIGFFVAAASFTCVVKFQPYVEPELDRMMATTLMAQAIVLFCVSPVRSLVMRLPWCLSGVCCVGACGTRLSLNANARALTPVRMLVQTASWCQCGGGFLFRAREPLPLPLPCCNALDAVQRDWTPAHTDTDTGTHTNTHTHSVERVWVLTEAGRGSLLQDDSLEGAEQADRRVESWLIIVMHALVFLLPLLIGIGKRAFRYKETYRAPLRPPLLRPSHPHCSPATRLCVCVSATRLCVCLQLHNVFARTHRHTADSPLAVVRARRRSLCGQRPSEPDEEEEASASRFGGSWRRQREEHYTNDPNSRSWKAVFDSRGRASRESLRLPTSLRRPFSAATRLPSARSWKRPASGSASTSTRPRRPSLLRVHSNPEHLQRELPDYAPSAKARSSEVGAAEPRVATRSLLLHAASARGLEGGGVGRDEGDSEAGSPVFQTSRSSDTDHAASASPTRSHRLLSPAPAVLSVDASPSPVVAGAQPAAPRTWIDKCAVSLVGGAWPGVDGAASLVVASDPEPEARAQFGVDVGWISEPAGERYQAGMLDESGVAGLQVDGLSASYAFSEPRAPAQDGALVVETKGPDPQWC